MKYTNSENYGAATQIMKSSSKKYSVYKAIARNESEFVWYNKPPHMTPQQFVDDLLSNHANLYTSTAKVLLTISVLNFRPNYLAQFYRLLIIISANITKRKFFQIGSLFRTHWCFEYSLASTFLYSTQAKWYSNKFWNNCNVTLKTSIDVTSHPNL